MGMAIGTMSQSLTYGIPIARSATAVVLLHVQHAMAPVLPAAGRPFHLAWIRPFQDATFSKRERIGLIYSQSRLLPFSSQAGARPTPRQTCRGDHIPSDPPTMVIPLNCISKILSTTEFGRARQPRLWLVAARLARTENPGVFAYL